MTQQQISEQEDVILLPSSSLDFGNVSDKTVKVHLLASFRAFNMVFEFEFFSVVMEILIFSTCFNPQN